MKTIKVSREKFTELSRTVRGSISGDSYIQFEQDGEQVRYVVDGGTSTKSVDEPEPRGTLAQRLGDEIRVDLERERAADRGDYMPPTPSPLRATPKPAQPQPVARSLRALPETGQQARLRCQRADDARRAERAGKRPGVKLASLLSGDDEPRGAA